MKTVLFAATLALALAMPTGAQTLDYGTLCGATEGTGDNNDFCTLWAQQNYQGMRNALTISIRTARAAENPNRFYFDHKRGAERGAFIQLKRPWMDDDDWFVRHIRTGRLREFVAGQPPTVSTRSIVIRMFCKKPNGLTLRLEFHECLAVFLRESAELSVAGRAYEDRSAGFDFLWVIGSLDDQARANEVDFSREEHMPSDYVRRVVECHIDLEGWYLGEVEERPDCSQIESAWQAR